MAKRQIPDECGYYNTELKTLNHSDPSEYADFLLNRFLDLCDNVAPKPKPYQVIMSAPEGPERQARLDEWKTAQMEKCIAPDADQLIHYSDWANPECFFKPSLMHLYHPHWRLAFDRMLSQYQRKNDVLVVLFCGGTKPYSKNKMFKTYLSAAKLGAFDLSVASLYPVPLYPFDASRLYPYVISDWPHDAGPRLTELSCEVYAAYFREFLIKTGYKRVIFSHLGFGDRQLMVDLAKQYAPESCEIIDLNQCESLLDRCMEKYPGFHHQPAFMSMRFFMFKLTRGLIAKYCSDPEFARIALKVDEMPKDRKGFCNLDEFSK